MRQSRAAGLAIITAIYVVAVVIGVVVYWALPDLHVFWRILVADVVATVFVYLTGVIVKNTSVYDPYWSVAPVVVLTGLAVEAGRVDAGAVLLLLAVWYWGVRLTVNWALTFRNLDAQDWRYDGFKQRFPRAYPLISLAGINLFPTLVVFGCLLPAVVFLRESRVNVLTVVGFLICVLATTLQFVADRQMHRFRRRNAGAKLIIREGLWEHSRHPNYLGEILIWWGVFVMMLSASGSHWLLGAGALVNTLMFLFVSIPLADKRNRAERVGFDEYVRQTNSLLPLRLKPTQRYDDETSASLDDVDQDAWASEGYRAATEQQ